MVWYPGYRTISELTGIDRCDVNHCCRVDFIHMNAIVNPQRNPPGHPLPSTGVLTKPSAYGIL